MSESIIVVEEKDSYAIIRMNRHAKRNAMNLEAREGMLAAFDQIKDRFSVVVLTGAETSFCAGIDLKEEGIRIEQGLPSDPATSWAAVNLAIRKHPAVFIAAVNGIALGGGTTLINMCDLAIASEQASMGMPEMSFAIYPGLAGPSTQHTLTRKRAAQMILTAKRIDGVTAERWGLVNEVVSHDKLMETAEQWALDVSQFNAIALTEGKRALDDIPNSIDWAAAFQYGEDKIDSIRARTEAATAGIDNFAKGERSAGQGNPV